MKIVVKILFLMSLVLMLGCASTRTDTNIRGTLVWNNSQQTIKPCGSEEIYWVRVLASNPHFLLSQKVEHLSVVAPQEIIAEFNGELSKDNTTFDSDYHVDGTLIVNQIISVEHGNCSK